MVGIRHAFWSVWLRALRGDWTNQTLFVCFFHVYLVACFCLHCYLRVSENRHWNELRSLPGPERPRIVHVRWHRLHGARGHPCPHFYTWLGTATPWVEEQQTRNWPSCTNKSAHHSPKRLIVFLEPKKWRGTTKKISFAPYRCPPLSLRTGASTFKFVPAPLCMCRLCDVHCRFADVRGSGGVHPGAVRGEKQEHDEGNLLSPDVRHGHHQHPVRVRRSHRRHHR